jgi:hypothetical protein
MRTPGDSLLVRPQNMYTSGHFVLRLRGGSTRHRRPVRCCGHNVNGGGFRTLDQYLGPANYLPIGAQTRMFYWRGYNVTMYHHFKDPHSTIPLNAHAMHRTGGEATLLSR